MDLFKELQDLMIKYHFRPEKKLSQFFCINQALLIYLTKISNLNETDIVLEIGPGTGFLTRELIKKAGKVIAVEKDETMFELLSKEFEKEIKEKKLEIINDDILKIDLKKLKINKVVSLPPYHISTDLVTKLTLSNLEQAVLVLDAGFVEKITAFEGLKEYTALTAFLGLNAEVNIVQKVENSSFFPKPNCLSAVANIEFEKIEINKEFYLFLKELFRHKNKDLSRALKQAMPFLENKLKIKFNKEKINLLKEKQTKVYLLSPKELLNVFKKLTKK